MLNKSANSEQFSEGLSIQDPSVGLGAVKERNRHFTNKLSYLILAQ